MLVLGKLRRQGKLVSAHTVVNYEQAVTPFLETDRAAEAHSIELVPHCACFGPGNLASIHIVASLAKDTLRENIYANLLAPKKIMLGVLDLSDPNVETPETIAARIGNGLLHLPAERLVPAPDCGMKYLPRDAAFGKLKAMSDGAVIVRQELM